MLQDLGTYMEALFVLTSALATDLPQQRNLADFLLACESNRISLHLPFSFYHKQMACHRTDSLIFHIFVRANTTVIFEAVFHI